MNRVLFGSTPRFNRDLISDHADRAKKPAAPHFYGILESNVIALRYENVWMPSPEQSHIALDYRP